MNLTNGVIDMQKIDTCIVLAEMLQEQLAILKESQREHPRELEQISKIVAEIEIDLIEIKKANLKNSRFIETSLIKMNAVLESIQVVKAFSNNANY